jgi:hypothetical protein
VLQDRPKKASHAAVSRGQLLVIDVVRRPGAPLQSCSCSSLEFTGCQKKPALPSLASVLRQRPAFHLRLHRTRRSFSFSIPYRHQPRSADLSTPRPLPSCPPSTQRRAKLSCPLQSCSSSLDISKSKSTRRCLRSRLFSWSQSAGSLSPVAKPTEMCFRRARDCDEKE